MVLLSSHKYKIQVVIWRATGCLREKTQTNKQTNTETDIK